MLLEFYLYIAIIRLLKDFYSKKRSIKSIRNWTFLFHMKNHNDFLRNKRGERTWVMEISDEDTSDIQKKTQVFKASRMENCVIPAAER